MLKSPFPLLSMWFYSSSKFFNRYQMGNLVDQGDQKAVFVQGGIDRYLVGAIRHSSIIPMAGISVSHNL